MTELTYRDEAGLLFRIALDAAVRNLPVERFRPIRLIRPRRKEVAIRGRYLFSKSGLHLVYESRLELLRLILLDFDRTVAAVSTQPFCLHIGGRSRYPDFFARLTTGEGCVFDVKPLAKLDDPKVQAAFARTRAACESVGWCYGTLSEPPLPLMTNLDLLHGFRFPQVDRWQIAEQLLEQCEAPTPLAHLSRTIEPRLAVRPVLFHLLWRGVLLGDIAERVLRESTLISRGDALHG